MNVQRHMMTRRDLVQGLAAIAAGAWCGSSTPSHAHTFTVREVECPVDGTKFKANATASYTTFGGYRDFAKRGAIGSLYSDMVIACPKCHFAGYPDDFGKPVAAATKAWVLGTLAKKYGTRRLDDAEECEAAAARYQFEGAKNEAIADLHLVASYILRGAAGPAEAVRKGHQRTAATFYQQALAAGEIAPDSCAAVTYLVGELLRRVGDHKAAIAQYDLAIAMPNAPDWLVTAAKEQRVLAAKGDANNDI